MACKFAPSHLHFDVHWTRMAGGRTEWNFAWAGSCQFAILPLRICLWHSARRSDTNRHGNLLFFTGKGINHMVMLEFDSLTLFWSSRLDP